MVEFHETKISRILNPTAIDLGEYVINPFMGCSFSCLYCYVRSNRVISKKNKPWGEFVDIRVNAPELLEKELRIKRPKTVLLGSTTECFQPIDGKYQVTRKILEILNTYKVYYIILTRSPLILEYVSLLKKGFCKQIYFTINDYSSEFKSALEPKSPGFEARDETVNSLLNQGVPVIPYFSPVLPWVSEVKEAFSKFEKAERIEFECLNFRLKNITDIIKNIAKVSAFLGVQYEKMCNDSAFYARSWETIKKEVETRAREAQKKYSIYIHNFGDFFKNTYS